MSAAEEDDRFLRQIRRTMMAAATAQTMTMVTDTLTMTAVLSSSDGEEVEAEAALETVHSVLPHAAWYAEVGVVARVAADLDVVRRI